MALEPPAGLDDDRRGIWRETVTAVLEAGTIARLDETSLAAYTEAVWNWRRATDLLRATDILIERDGKPAPNPALAIQAEAARVIAVFARQFRLTAGGLGQRPAAIEPQPAGGGHAPCATCGQPHDPDHCQGHSRDGTQCRLAKGQRTDHPGFGNCGYHLGATPSGRQHAMREQASAALFKLARHGEVRPVSDPLELLADLAGEAVAWKDAIAGLVNELPSLTGEDHAGDERLRALVPLMERAMTQAGRFAVEMAKLDIDERLVGVHRRAAELAGADLVALIDRVARALGHDPGDPGTRRLIAGALGPGRELTA
jgi:P27 family predicted phage terminase small subunit